MIVQNLQYCNTSECTKDVKDHQGHLGGGITDVPPFLYTDQAVKFGAKSSDDITLNDASGALGPGGCFMTPNYCTRFSTDYSKAWAECAFETTKDGCDGLLDTRTDLSITGYTVDKG